MRAMASHILTKMPFLLTILSKSRSGCRARRPPQKLDGCQQAGVRGTLFRYDLASGIPQWLRRPSSTFERVRASEI